MMMVFINNVLADEIYSYIDTNGVRTYTNNTTINQSVKIYKFVDTKGVIHLTDKPKHPGYKLIYQNSVNIPSLSSRLDFSSSVPIHKKYSNYRALIEEVASRTHLEPALLHAIIQTESGYNPKAISPKGAVGLMQLMPETAKRFGVTNLTEASSNLYGGAYYLRYLLDLFNNDNELAIAAYNAGENAVKRYGNKIPPYRETKHYVKKVMALYLALRDRN